MPPSAERVRKKPDAKLCAVIAISMVFLTCRSHPGASRIARHSSSIISDGAITVRGLPLRRLNRTFFCAKKRQCLLILKSHPHTHKGPPCPWDVYPHADTHPRSTRKPPHPFLLDGWLIARCVTALINCELPLRVLCDSA